MLADANERVVPASATIAEDDRATRGGRIDRPPIYSAHLAELELESRESGGGGEGAISRDREEIALISRINLRGARELSGRRARARPTRPRFGLLREQINLWVIRLWLELLGGGGECLTGDLRVCKFDGCGWERGSGC